MNLAEKPAIYIVNNNHAPDCFKNMQIIIYLVFYKYYFPCF